jgi:DNA processing protein
MKENERPYALFLVSVPWIGRGPVHKLLDRFGSPRAVFEASDDEIKNAAGKSDVSSLLEYRNKNDIFEKYEEINKSGMKITFLGEDDYPERLELIPDPPFALFYYGNLPNEDRMSVAVIGARQCSGYGEDLAKKLGRALAENDINVISGMAVGIDGISQIAVTEAGGYTAAVLGSGVDVCYPESNRYLYDMLKETGCVLSEYPPGTVPKANYFPPRNRIVSGLSDAVVVLEARIRSGTLITVDMALDQGKDIYAAPGRLGDHLSAGCNGLIGHGARVYLDPEIFMKDLAEDHICNFSKRVIKPAVKPVFDSPADKRHRAYSCGKEKEPDLDKSHLEIYRELTFFPKSVEEINASLQKKGTESPGETGLILILMELCLQDLALQVSPGQFIRK